MYYMDIIQV